MTLQEVRNNISSRLQKAGIESFDYETWVFLDEKLGIDRGEYFMNPSMEVDQERLAELEKCIIQRENRVPLQYIMNHCDFMGYDFYVDERVLIPRMDTECLVEEAVNFLKWKQLTKKELRVLDLCTGSGCIGISLKLLVPEIDLTLADLSSGAIEVARKNAQNLDVSLRICQGDLFEALDQLEGENRRFDLIVSNPPYIPSKVVEGLMPEVKDHEPHMALDGREDGLFFYRKITQESTNYLKAGGGLFYEIGAEQGEDVANLLKNQGFDQVLVVKDLAGLDRIVKGRLLS